MNRQEQRTAFLKALAEDRFDRGTHLVFADWHDEHGDPTEALGWRLLAGQRRWPAENGYERYWARWRERDEGGNMDDWHWLPVAVFDRLVGGQRYVLFMDYASDAAALADAARAFGLAWLAGKYRP